ncbi:MAG: hypothetical protein FWC90_06275 [Oscillospiraceae bacterium]|nr:hypothetical protein [Oscillospiraceae bacterium]
MKKLVLLGMLAMLFLIAGCTGVSDNKKVADEFVSVWRTKNFEENAQEFWAEERYAAIYVTEDEFVGVWRTKDFEKNAREFWAEEEYAAIYVTADGNLYILITNPLTSAGPITNIYRFHYEFVDNQLRLTPIEADGNRFPAWLDAVQISADTNGIRLEPTAFVFYKLTDEIPYGWTDADRQEIVETNAQIRAEIFALADRFSEVLGLSVLPDDIDRWDRHTGDRFLHQHQIPFTIANIPIEIAFIGAPPLPTQPQRHTRVFGPSFLEMHHPEIRNASDRFVLVYNDWDYDVPTEWLDIFADLDHSQ